MSPAPIGAATRAAAPPATAGAGSHPSFREVLDARAGRPCAAERAGHPAGLAAAATAGLEWIERQQARLDGVLAAARSGRTFTAQELLGLQAAAYRYSQAVELSAKLVEQGAQAVKQALHAQV